MDWALPVGRVLGVRLRLHYLFLFLVVVLVGMALVRRGPGIAALVLLLFLVLFGSVLLHELGHALVARRLGVVVRDITLLPIGGVARMEEMPERPLHEVLIAVAGPAVNVAIAAALVPAAVVLEAARLEAWLAGDPRSFPLVAIVAVPNLAMAAFNLVPAFPMDGGRVLRAVLSARGGYLRGTRQAVRVSRVLAALFALVALPTGEWLLVAVALFVWWAGSQEERTVQVRAIRRALEVATPLAYPAAGGRWGQHLLN
ncbi:MAG: site-2 protease family protein [Planctomycetes bacterium]|nr:site-2 protease family protein [Planctomycetota bacterium]